MRQKYPVTSEEMLVELRDLQETLISLIGYDANAFDDFINISGSVDMLTENIDASGYAFTQDRIFKKEFPTYRTFYNGSLILYNARRR
jgi:hypothetical protein